MDLLITGATGNVVGRLAAPLAMVEIPRTEKISEKDLVVTLGAKAGKRFDETDGSADSINNRQLKLLS